jgi:hypothetical protein
MKVCIETSVRTDKGCAITFSASPGEKTVTVVIEGDGEELEFAMNQSDFLAAIEALKRGLGDG